MLCPDAVRFRLEQAKLDDARTVARELVSGMRPNHHDPVPRRSDGESERKEGEGDGANALRAT